MNTLLTDVKNLAALAATTLVVAGCGNSGGEAMKPVPAPVNYAPTLSTISDRTVDQDTALAVDFTVDDRESGAGSLIVAASADGNALFPADGVVLSGTGAARTLALTPLEAATGKATIVVRATDSEGAATTRSFAVTVNARIASIRDSVLATFAKVETDDVTVVNGWTPQQDANDPATFAGLIPPGDE